MNIKDRIEEILKEFDESEIVQRYRHDVVGMGWKWEQDDHRKVRNSLEKIVSDKQSLTFRQLRIFYEEKGFKLNENFHRTLNLVNEDGEYNYLGYMMADENGLSMKVAKYRGITKVNLGTPKI